MPDHQRIGLNRRQHLPIRQTKTASVEQWMLRGEFQWIVAPQDDQPLGYAAEAAHDGSTR